jgi:hypothetical protein
MSQPSQGSPDDDFSQMLKRVRAAAGTEGTASSEPAPFRNSGPKKKQGERPAWVSLIGPAVIVGVTVFGLYGLMRIAVWSTTRIVAQGAGLGVGIQRKRQLQQQRLERWRVATDSTITPLAAGKMLHELFRAGWDSTLLQWERPIDSAFQAPKCCEQFTRAASVRFDPKVDWSVAAFAAARRGFTPEQRTFLRGLSQGQALALFRVVARAREADMGGGLWEVPFDAPVAWPDLPTIRIPNIRSLALANVAAAALDLEAGRVALAEQRVREVISVGFLIQRGGRTTVEELYGGLLVLSGRASLEALYDAVGRKADAALVSARSDTAIPSIIGNSERVRTSELHATLRRRILDTTELTGTRWQLMLGPFAYLPCTSVRQMIFGPSKQHRAALDEFKAALVKYPSDARRFSMVARSMGQLIDPAWRGRPASGERPAWAAGVSSVTRNRQLEQCASLFRR